MHCGLNRYVPSRICGAAIFLGQIDKILVLSKLAETWSRDGLQNIENKDFTRKIFQNKELAPKNPRIAVVCG